LSMAKLDVGSQWGIPATLHRGFLAEGHRGPTPTERSIEAVCHMGPLCSTTVTGMVSRTRAERRCSTRPRAFPEYRSGDDHYGGRTIRNMRCGRDRSRCGTLGRLRSEEHTSELQSR